MRDIVYPVVVAAAKTWFRLGDVRIEMTGTEHIPREGGALAPVDPPCRFGFSSTPRRPGVTSVVTTVERLGGAAH